MFDSIRNRGRPRLGPHRARAGLTLAACAAYLAVSGCGSISVNDSTPTAASAPSYDQVAPALPAGPAHDLAILAVDFDPALNVQSLMRHTPINLIVGISNQGTQRESNVRIKADLWSADGSLNLLHTEQTVDAIAAGNVLAVRLLNNSTPPVLTRYHLTVEIVPVAGETSILNNSRSLDIVVNTGE